MGVWIYFALISIFVMLATIAFWIVSSCCKFSILECVKNKYCSYICLGLIFIVWLGASVLSGIYLQNMFTQKSSSGNSNSDTAIIHGIKNTVETSKESIKSLDLSTLTPFSSTPLDDTLVGDIEAKFEIFSSISSTNRRIQTNVKKARKIKEFLIDIQTDCTVDYVFNEFDELLTTTDKWSKGIETSVMGLNPKMKTTINALASTQVINKGIEDEKQVLEEHQTKINTFLGKLATSLKTVEETVDKRVLENEKDQLNNSAKAVFAVMVILPGVFILILFIFGIILLSAPRACSSLKKVAIIFFYVSLSAVLISLLIYVIMMALDSGECSSSSPDSSLQSNEFDFTFPYFHEPSRQSTNAAIKECGLNKNKLFTEPNDKIYISESLFIKKYCEMWNADIALFLKDIKKVSFSLEVFHSKISELEEVLRKLEEDTCSNPSDKTKIQDHRTVLQHLGNDTSLTSTQLNPLISDLKKNAQQEIEKALKSLKNTIKSQIDIMDQSLKNCNFECDVIHTALTDSSGTKCKKLEFNPFGLSSVVILLSSCCCFSASIFLSSFGVKEKKEQKKEKTADDETKHSATELAKASATELAKDSSNVQLAKDSSNVQLAKAMSTVSAKGGEISTNPIELWANLISSANFEDVLIAFDESLVNFKPPNATYKASDANKNLNHNKNYQCIDESRVILKDRKNEYINASWVRVPNSKTPYIITQNPLAETIADFWAMCYAEKVKCIVSFCSPDEGLGKCVPYFATDGKETKCTGYIVKIGEPKKDVLKNIIVRKLQVLDSNKSGAQPLFINHVTVSWWPKKADSEKESVPREAQSAIQLHRWAKKLYPDVSPICVVSEEGLGRSATFVLLDYAIIRLQQGAKMVDIVKDFRGMRNMAIENRTQYEVLHALLLEYFADEGVVDTVVLEKFKKNYTDRHFS